jgi:hypothetical protein
LKLAGNVGTDTYEKLHNFKAVHIIGQKIQARENKKK